MADMEKPLVVITGVSGYLGSQTCLAFLQDGSYRVRGTVRKTTNQTKIRPIKQGLGHLFEELELVQADLNDEASIIRACQGATYVIHTASPFHFRGSCTGPAVAGTLAVLRGCTEHAVKRVVITSSCAAVQAPADEAKPAPGEAYNETYWSDPNRKQGLSDYQTSKTLAERAAWDYQTLHPELEVVCLNPCFIMGPSLCAGDGTSEGFMKAILKGKKNKIPRGGTSFVDVRDCANAHRLAVQVPEAANRRFILYNHRVEHAEYYGWLAHFNEAGAKVATAVTDGEQPNEFDLIDNSASQQVLGVVYRSMESTIVECARSLIIAGKVPCAKLQC